MTPQQYATLMHEAYHNGDQHELDRLYRLSQIAAGERCPDCNSTGNIERSLQGDTYCWHCNRCDYVWNQEEEQHGMAT